MHRRAQRNGVALQHRHHRTPSPLPGSASTRRQRSTGLSLLHPSNRLIPFINSFFFCWVPGVLLHHSAVAAENPAVPLSGAGICERKLVGALAPEQLARETSGVPAQIPRTLRSAGIGAGEQRAGRIVPGPAHLLRQRVSAIPARVRHHHPPVHRDSARDQIAGNDPGTLGLSLQIPRPPRHLPLHDAALLRAETARSPAAQTQTRVLHHGILKGRATGRMGSIGAVPDLQHPRFRRPQLDPRAGLLRETSQSTGGHHGQPLAVAFPGHGLAFQRIPQRVLPRSLRHCRRAAGSSGQSVHRGQRSHGRGHAGLQSPAAGIAARVVDQRRRSLIDLPARIVLERALRPRR